VPKILRIINRFNIGGPTYNAAYLTKHLAPEFETMLVAGMKQDSEESSEFIVESLGLPVQRIPEMRRELDPVRDLAAYRHIRRLIRSFRPDIVHTHAAKAGALGRLAAAACGVPVVLHTFHGHVFHSYFSPARTRFFLAVERYLARRSTAVIALSENQKDELCNRFRVCVPSKCLVVPLGFDLGRAPGLPRAIRHPAR
jgi:UDP-N-acetylglucosamine:LPS N-acetylglucosamine transferase